MVATGNKPPYGVRHLPEKSKGVFAAILLGSEYDFREPCGTGGLRVCLERFITIWVTPGNGSRSCYFAATLFYNSIFRGSKWLFFFTHSRSPQNLCIRQVQQGLPTFLAGSSRATLATHRRKWHWD